MNIAELSGDGIRLIFDAEHGEVISLADGEREYIAARLPIFRAAFLDACGKRLTEDASSMKPIACSQSGNVISASYEGALCTATVTAELCDGILWGITVSPRSDLTAEWVNYPQIAVSDKLSRDGSRILWGFNEGVLIDDIDERERIFGYIEPDYPSKGVMGLYPAIVETQFMAYLDGSGGLYLGAHDAEDALKGVDFYRVGNGAVLLQLRHFCGCRPGDEYRMPYPVVTRSFIGGWECAAEIYRTWFDKNKSSAFVPIAENGALPEWYGESPVVVTYPVRGTHDTDRMEPNAAFPYVNAMKQVERLEKELGSRIMVLLMHWEGTAPWAPPQVWPPFGGEEELGRFIDALHERGDLIGVYCSGIGWTLRSNLVEYDTSERFEREGLAEEMCLSPEQTLPYSNICTAQRVGYDMCPTRDFTVDTVVSEVEKMVGAGIDYIQLLDQNHGGTPYFCYSKSHGHPPVPGKWQVDAMKSLLSKVVRRGGKTLFGCESAAAEAYAPYLLFSDDRFELNYATGVQVPLYAYLFHEYLNNFMGNQVCVGDIFDHDASPDNILERIAYSFSAGDMLTLVLDQYGEITWNWGKFKASAPPDREKVKTLVRSLNAWRVGVGKRYLHTGRMVKGLNVVCGSNSFVRRGDMPNITRPRLHTSAWLSREGTVGQFLINYNGSEESCRVSFPCAGYRLVYSSGNEIALGEGETEISVPPLSAVLIERK